MTLSLSLVCLVVAMVLFALAASKRFGDLDLMAAGLFFFALGIAIR